MIDIYRAQKAPKPVAASKQADKYNYLLTDLNILKLPRLPARLTTEETAFLLRIEKQDIPWIVEADILMPCGQPADTAQKWYSTVAVLTLMEDPERLSDMTKAISDRWAEKNARRPKKEKAVKNFNQKTQEEEKTTGH